ncbi:transcription termination/antitermination NusG family protein [Pontiellaceae bacterium B12227]|nr:transcription termination/antitermination NusG family protein [Pontiellaceae bacterium B12227]
MDKAFQCEPGELWYCVRTKPKKERMAAANMAALHGLEVFCPQIRFRRKTARGPVWFQEAMFPGYMFARFDMFENKRLVSYSPGVLNLPTFNGRYVPVPESVIKTIQKDLDDNGSVDAGMPLEVGEETTVLEGSMRGLKVKVIKVMTAEARVAVLLEMLGTLVEAEFPVDALEHRTEHRAADD